MFFGAGIDYLQPAGIDDLQPADITQGKWYGKEDEDKARFVAEAAAAAETLRVAQAAVEVERTRHQREMLARACRGFVPPPVKQWQTAFGWDTARAKRPTAAAEKYCDDATFLANFL